MQQPDMPYQLVETIGSTPVGRVWSAFDGQGRRYTVAVLTPVAAGDAGWRAAFGAVAQSLAMSMPGLVTADPGAGTPWIACLDTGGPGAERAFQLLGQEYRHGPPDPWVAPPPVSAPPGANVGNPGGRVAAKASVPVPNQQPPNQQPPISQPPASVGAPPEASVSAPPVGPTSGPPLGPVSGPPASAEPNPWATPPAQVGPDVRRDFDVPSGAFKAPRFRKPLATPAQEAEPVPAQPPEPPAPEPVPAGHAHSPTGQQAAVGTASVGPSATPPGGYPIPPAPEPERKSGTGRWMLIAVVALVVLGAGGGIFAWRYSAQTTGTPEPTSSPTAQALPPAPTQPPLSPGIEPPKAGQWPASWPQFTPADRVRTLTGLEGLGFPVKVPAGWDCTLGERAQGYVRYQCNSDQPGTGGDIIVRDCPGGCGEADQRQRRTNEEAWGVPWTTAGPSAAFAQTDRLQLDGQTRYGLVVVAFWRGGPDGELDKQLVLRMTAPAAGADDLRRIAYYLRNTLLF